MARLRVDVDPLWPILVDDARCRGSVTAVDHLDHHEEFAGGKRLIADWIKVLENEESHDANYYYKQQE